MTGQIIADKLRQSILSGGLKPGSELRQSDIAEQFNVSRIPVRDALGLLASEKLVVLQPNRKAHVIALTQDELAEVYDLRILLERNVLSFAIKHITPDTLDHVAYALEKSNLEADRPGWANGDWAFHKALYEPSKRFRQIQIIAELRQACQLHIAAYDTLTKNTPQWLDDHKSILDCYQAGDAKMARDVLTNHLTAAKQSLLHAMVGV